MNLSSDKMDGRDLPITQTRISASEWNQLVASCMAIIQAAELTPDSEDGQQLLNAIKTVVANMELVGANTALSNLTEQGETHFIKPDLSNINQTGQENIISIVNNSLQTASNPLAPDYSRAIGRTWGQTYTADMQGYVLLSIRTYNSQGYLTICGRSFMMGGYDDNDGGGDSIMVPVAIGDTYAATGSAQSVSQYLFIPIKGATV